MSAYPRHHKTLLAIIDDIGHWATLRGNDRHLRGQSSGSSCVPRTKRRRPG
jgi:hypothetical protein